MIKGDEMPAIRLIETRVVFEFVSSSNNSFISLAINRNKSCI